MFPAFLDTAQRDFVEAQASSGKATPLVTAQQALSEAQAKATPLVTAQQALLEAQASSVKASILTAPSAVATCPRPVVTSSVTLKTHVLL